MCVTIIWPVKLTSETVLLLDLQAVFVYQNSFEMTLQSDDSDLLVLTQHTVELSACIISVLLGKLSPIPIHSSLFPLSLQ